MKAVASKPPNATPSKVPAFPPTPAAFGAQGLVRPGRGGSFHPSEVAHAGPRATVSTRILAILREGRRFGFLRNTDGAARDGKG